MRQLLIIIAFFSIVLASCKKDAYEQFEGTYDIKSSGSINFLIDDSTFVNEPGIVVITKGNSKDELFMYVETNYVTSIAPLGVYVRAEIDGNKYKMDQRNENITLDLGLGAPLSLPFSVSATGELSDDGKTLTSQIIFSGGINGAMKSVGTKK